MNNQSICALLIALHVSQLEGNNVNKSTEQESQHQNEEETSSYCPTNVTYAQQGEVTKTNLSILTWLWGMILNHHSGNYNMIIISVIVT